jgi:protein-S-isoprenylcysteine O-methyltransferase Ste14
MRSSRVSISPRTIDSTSRHSTGYDIVAVLAALHVAWLALLPFAEEPWLEAEFGENYERYCDRVPRFVGWKTFHRPTR